jgi:TetR/AcrR family transcriptional repressor of nem operon
MTKATSGAPRFPQSPGSDAAEPTDAIDAETLHTGAPRVARLQAYADLFETTYRTNRSLRICGMLGAEADSLPDEVNIEVRRFFAVNIEWLTMVLSEGIMKGSIRNIASAQDLAESFLDAMAGALITGRTSPNARGPRRAADVILAALSS